MMIIPNSERGLAQTVPVFAIWLSGYLDDKTSLTVDNVKRIREKLNEAEDALSPLNTLNTEYRFVLWCSGLLTASADLDTGNTAFLQKRLKSVLEPNKPAQQYTHNNWRSTPEQGAIDPRIAFDQENYLKPLVKNPKSMPELNRTFSMAEQQEG